MLPDWVSLKGPRDCDTSLPWKRSLADKQADIGAEVQGLSKTAEKLCPRAPRVRIYKDSADGGWRFVPHRPPDGGLRRLTFLVGLVDS